MSSSIIKIENATISQHKKVVLKEVSLEIAAGAFVYFIGRTGSGKSSLIRTMYAAMPLTAGEIHICKTALSKLKKRHIHKLRLKLGIVFQDFKLLPDRNVYQNLSFVLRATGWKNKVERNTRIGEVLTLVGLENKEKRFPQTLSGGEQQRLSIARALLNSPKVLLADEPTGNLDPITRWEIMEVLRNINKQGTTVLMATHDFSIIQKYPGKTFKCEDGLVTEVLLKNKNS
ncbi:MAG: ATP-binding cassette domain-containing protein [Bacteroidetes bacterium]|nr:ATP-binding cassette domain-containing protein [Bacteroidota bacterium]MDA1085161.1 ATP-binding cassette domain-containing protein [Bacteroidota bacterium]